jgi:HEAT repeat protein
MCLAVPDISAMVENLREKPYTGGVEWSVGTLDDIRKQGTVVIPFLLTGLKNKNVNVRAWSVMLLGSPPVTTKGAPLIAQSTCEKDIDTLLAMHNDPDPSVRLAVATIITYLNEHRAILPLITLIKDKDLHVRLIAILRAGELHDPLLIPALTDSLSDIRKFTLPAHADPGVMTIGASAAFSLERIGVAAEPAIRKALHNTNPNIRRFIIVALGFSKNPAPWKFDAVLEALSDTEPAVQECALAILYFGRFYDDFNNPIIGYGNLLRAVEPLHKALSAKTPVVRASAACALGRFKSKKVTAILIEALKDTDINVREGVIQALGENGDESAVPALLPFMNDKTLGQITARRLAAMGQTGIQALLKVSESNNPDLRVTAAYGLVSCSGYPDAINRVFTLAVDPAAVTYQLEGKNVGECVQRVLNQSNTYERAVEILKNDERPYLIGALRRVRGTYERRIVPLLIGYLRDRDEQVRQLALDALELISNQQPFGSDQVKWEEWWAKEQKQKPLK